MTVGSLERIDIRKKASLKTLSAHAHAVDNIGGGRWVEFLTDWF